MIQMSKNRFLMNFSTKKMQISTLETETTIREIETTMKEMKILMKKVKLEEDSLETKNSIRLIRLKEKEENL